MNTGMGIGNSAARPKMPTAEDERMIRWASEQMARHGFDVVVSWRAAKAQYDIILIRKREPA